jgi:hypothetical protein
MTVTKDRTIDELMVDFGKAITRFTKSQFEMVETAYRLTEAFARDGLDLQAALYQTHIVAVESYGEKISQGMIHSWYETAAALVRETDGFNWVKGRSYSQHYRVTRNSQWTFADLIAKPYPEKRDGKSRPLRAETRAKRGLAMAVRGFNVLVAEHDNAGDRDVRRYLKSVIDAMAEIPAIRKETLRAMGDVI